MTTLNVTLSAELQNELGTQGVWAYAVYFPTSTGPGDWTILVNNGTIENQGTVPVALPETFVAGKVYLIVQSETNGALENLPNLITQQSVLSWGTAAADDFAYDSFEVTLQNQGPDVGNLTSVNSFALPMEVSVEYNNGTTAHVGYMVSGSSIVSDIQNINAANTYAYDYTSGPLAGDFRMAVAPALAASDPSPVPGSPAFKPDDWDDYVKSLEGTLAARVEITGLFNGAPTADSVWHNGGYFAYRLQWDADTAYFSLVPMASSEIKGYIRISPTELEDSIYATNGTVDVFTNMTDSKAFLSGMNMGANNQWGKVLSEFLTGFTGGFYNEIGTLFNSQLQGTVDLSESMNWDPDYAFQQNVMGPQPNYQAYDPYSKIFYFKSNSYGSGYSDALMSEYAVGGPLISVSEPSTPNQGQNVPDIDLTLFANGETPGGYTPPVIYNSINAPAGEYVVPSTAPTGNNITLNFAVTPSDGAGMVLNSTDTIQLNILTSDTGNSPTWSTVTINGADGGAFGLWQLWTITYDPVRKTFSANDSANVAKTAGTMVITGFPTATNGVSWYQLVIGDKTFNLYTTSTNGAFDNPAYGNQAGSLAIDGLAQIVPGGTSLDPTTVTFSVNLAYGATIVIDPSLLIANTSTDRIGDLPIPSSPVAGIQNNGTFEALPEQLAENGNTIATFDSQLSFGWTGDNSAPNKSTWIKTYSNKIDPEDVARVTITPHGGGAPITAVGTADIDGQWQTGTVNLDPGSYDITMQEYLPSDTGFTTPISKVSNSLTLTEDLGGVLCFLKGTLIRTDLGEVPVECLTVGDTVLTARGSAEKIVWIGVGRVLAERGRRTAATPVIVRKGALGDNRPHRDLRITKAHSLSLDGVLIPVEYLVNHRSILWDDHAQEVELYHVELAHHDVLIANGAPAESYRDDGNRWLFQNANSGWDQPAKPLCAPVLTGGPVVDRAWRRLLDLAGPRPGLPLTRDPDLHLLVDGERVDCVVRNGAVHEFRLAGVPRALSIVSRTGAPAELGLARDPRVLGVAVRRIELHTRSEVRRIDAADSILTAGFYTFEPDNGFRWTDGYAALDVRSFEDCSGPLTLLLHVGGTTQYVASSAIDVAA